MRLLFLKRTNCLSSIDMRRPTSTIAQLQEILLVQKVLRTLATRLSNRLKILKNLWVSYVFEKSWKSCYKLCKKIAEKGPKDTDNDATPDLYAMDELKPEEKKDIAKIQKNIFMDNWALHEQKMFNMTNEERPLKLTLKIVIYGK
jgi:hypothetical protein